MASKEWIADENRKTFNCSGGIIEDADGERYLPEEDVRFIPGLERKT
jgi:hypothetical protein